MKLTYEFVIADKVKVKISSEEKVIKCFDFIAKIYDQFEKEGENISYLLNVVITDKLPSYAEVKYKLGKDGFSTENQLFLSSGHCFEIGNSNITVYIPTRVKRGRIPFKRGVVGRHVTDEIIEPMLRLIFLKLGMTYVHASTIIENQRAELVMGWRGSGKTEKVLSEIQKGKEIWSDDLAIIDDRGFVYPNLRPIRLYYYNSYKKIKSTFLSSLFYLLKAKVTPKWQPVEYVKLKNHRKEKKIKLHSLTYLNKPVSEDIAQDVEDVINFEFNYFKHIEIMLSHCGFINFNTSPAEILRSAFNAR